MVRRMFVATGTAVALAVAMGCAQSGPTVSPSAALPASDAAPDGSTLKATPPGLVSPAAGVITDSTEPVFVISNSTGRFVDATFDYRIWIEDPTGSFVYNSPKLGSGLNGQTSWEIPIDLELDSPYRWRARAEFSTFFGPWSEFQDFRTIDYRGLVPRPPGGNWPTTGPAVLDYIGSVFPLRLAPTATLGRRITNTEFLRDRIIEAGVCGGLDLARNLKRGIGPHSHDAIAYRFPNGDVDVIDFALAFDDFGSTMTLSWQTVEGPSGYDPLPEHPGC